MLTARIANEKNYMLVVRYSFENLQFTGTLRSPWKAFKRTGNKAKERRRLDLK